jgi:Beta-propeller repeat
LSKDGSRIEWTTYLGGSDQFTFVWKVRVDRRGFVYICGTTAASDFPTTRNAFDSALDGDFDGIVAVLTPNGATLVYSSFLGGSLSEFLWGLTLLSESPSSGRGGVLMAVTGYTGSPDFPLVHAVDAPLYEADAVVSVIDPTGGGLLYSSRIPGGDWSEVGLSIAARGDTLAVSGVTTSAARARLVAWHHAFEGDRGVAQMSAANPAWAASPGYGNFWNQVLTKPFTLPAGPVAATFVARWQTEHGFDFLRFRISLDGGVTWTVVAELDGFSNGFESRSIDLTSYAGQSVLLQFQFLSDELGSDQDGEIDTNGSAIDSIAITGFAPDYFDSGLDGWVSDDSARALPADFRYGPLGGSTDAFIAW